MINNKYSKILFISINIIVIFGLFMIYSSSSIWAEYKFNDSFKYVKMQTLFYLFGLLLVYIINKIDINYLKKYSNILLLISFLLLLLVLIPGIGSVRNGSRSWFGIGPFGIQPSEFSKLALIIFTSKYLSNNQKNMKSFKNGLLPILIVIILNFLLIILEPDFGSAFVITLSLIVLILTSGIKLSYFIKFALLGLIGIIFLILTAPYRFKRILSFLNPWIDPLGSGYQIIQSLYSISPSGIFGVGYLNSIQKQFYLPESHTDFIFSIICEEFGILGVIFVISLLLIILITSIKISIRQNDLFKKYLSFGLSISIIIQSLLNLSVVCGLIPVTGVTLPFLSYGGSSLLITLCSMGIILNISRNN